MDCRKQVSKKLWRLDLGRAKMIASGGKGTNIMSKPSDADMAEIRAFIGSVEWRFARTMPQWPHFYNVLEWNPEKKAGFFKLVSTIFNHGYQREWPSPEEQKKSGSDWKRIVTYFNVDEFKYWVMSDAIEKVGLINRANVD
jgi:hypothetical protein